MLKDGRAGVPCLLAGVSGRTGCVAALSPAARDALRADGLHLLGPGESNSREWDFVVRVAYPDADAEVLTGKDLEAQARTLADWIERAFRDAQRGLATA